jgi:CRP-like cAMP-binding protein
MNIWARKLATFGPLAMDDERLLDQLIANAVIFPAGEDIISQGDLPTDLHVVLEGCACRYKVLPDGRRQIIAFLLPGDLCDLHVFLLREMDHSIGAITASRVATISRDTILEITSQRPQLTRALWWGTLVDEAILREWIVALGRRTAYERIAHLICELYLRLKVVGVANGQSFELPITQTELADTMGLSLVHVNRVLQRLRGEGVVEFQSRTVIIRDAERLKQIALFDPIYLHQQGGTNA